MPSATFTSKFRRSTNRKGVGSEVISRLMGNGYKLEGRESSDISSIYAGRMSDLMRRNCQKPPHIIAVGSSESLVMAP